LEPPLHSYGIQSDKHMRKKKHKNNERYPPSHLQNCLK
jgi:hypothetical protein